jgi:hypothetical protein
VNACSRPTMRSETIGWRPNETRFATRRNHHHLHHERRPAADAVISLAEIRKQPATIVNRKQLGVTRCPSTNLRGPRPRHSRSAQQHHLSDPSGSSGRIYLFTNKGIARPLPAPTATRRPEMYVFTTADGSPRRMQYRRRWSTARTGWVGTIESGDRRTAGPRPARPRPLRIESAP